MVSLYLVLLRLFVEAEAEFITGIDVPVVLTKCFVNGALVAFLSRLEIVFCLDNSF